MSRHCHVAKHLNLESIRGSGCEPFSHAIKQSIQFDRALLLQLTNEKLHPDVHNGQHDVLSSTLEPRATHCHS